MKLNNKGMVMYSMIIVLAIMLGALDCASFLAFLLSKVACGLLLFTAFKLLKFVPSKYTEE